MTSPAITPKPLSPAALLDLTHVSSILHLAHHRNKNQHRRAAWYRPFSLLRRHLNHLVSQYGALASVPDTYAARHRKKAIDRTTQSRIEAELKYFFEVLVPRCHCSFSQLVADLRFAVLGVVLLAALSSICSILGISKGYEQFAEDETVRILQRFEAEQWGPASAATSKAKGQRPPVAIEGVQQDSNGEDQGEVVSRKETVSNKSPIGTAPVPDAGDAVGSSREKADLVMSSGKGITPYKKKRAQPENVDQPIKKKKKSRKERGDAIDDLFDGL